MKRCSNCGFKLKKDEKFCRNCGVSQAGYQSIQPTSNQDSYSLDDTYYTDQYHYQQEQDAYYEARRSDGPVYSNQITEHNLPEKYQPVGAWGYIGYDILFGIPIVGLILAIIFAVSDKKINRRNYARSKIIRLIINIVLAVIIYFLIRELIFQFVNYFQHILF